jgi:hypothetical protein
MTTSADNPLVDGSQDSLGRRQAAAKFAAHVLEIDVSGGVVVGVLGPWGSGKTTFVNFARESLIASSVPIVDFNPWMFSGADQLVERFFIEVGAELKLKPGMAEIGKDFEEYGELFSGLGWLPVVGPWIERARGGAKLIGKLMSSRREGVRGRRERLEAALNKLETPLVVVLDDIDRLMTAEIRDVFKLVRLTASFPKVVYVLAFDRDRVEQALSEQGIPGRDYLEKILQLAIDLPAVPPKVLDSQVFAGIDAALTGVEKPGPFDEGRWADVYYEIVRPLISNMRDVRRYTLAVRGSVVELEGEVSLVDVAALEAIRVFLPDIHRRLPEVVAGLTTASPIMHGGSDPAHLKAQVELLLTAAGEHSAVVRALVERVFPAGARHLGGMGYGADWRGEWLAARRVAHPDVLWVYLQRAIGPEMQAHIQAEHAYSLMRDGDTLAGFLSGISADRIHDVIASLENLESQFAEEDVVGGVTALLNVAPQLPDVERGMFGLDSRMVVGRVVYRLLRQVEDHGRLEALVDQIIPKLLSLSAEFELITTVGYREGAGHKLISETRATDLEKAWRERVRAASEPELAAEHELLRLYIFEKQGRGEGEAEMPVPQTTELTAALLKAAVSIVRSNSMGNRAVRQEKHLVWDSLIEIFGNEAVLNARLDEAKRAGVPSLEEELALADKYREGWRPERW